MKKIILGLSVVIMLSSCATVLGGRLTKHQLTKPAKGAEKRRVRIVPIIFNLGMFPIGIGIDFLTGAAYKPYKVSE